MVSTFDPLEADLFGDLVGDTHGLWEVFEFVRSHHPKLSDEQVLELGRDYITRWIQSGWICISDAPLYPSTITSLTQWTSCSSTARPLHATWRIRRRSILQTKVCESMKAKPSNQSVELTATRCYARISHD